MKTIFVKTLKLLFLTAVIVSTSSCNNKKSDEAIEDTDIKKVESINENVFIDSNDTKLYAEIRGKNNTKPVILFLHGGPGDVALGLIPFQVYAGKKLEENFVMVYLHQRGLVNSLAVPDSTQTIENHISDVENVIHYLNNKLNREKIILMGHSWGGLLGSLYLIKEDFKVEKFIAIASPFNFNKSNLESLNYTLEWAKSTQKQEAILELSEQVKPPINTFDKQLVKSKWASQAYGGIAKNFSIEKIINDSDYKEIKIEWQVKTLDVAKAMFDSLNTINIENHINEVNVPILFMAGKNDANVPPITVKEVFDRYKNEKEFVLFENSHHLIFVDEPDFFVKEVKEFLSK